MQLAKERSKHSFSSDIFYTESFNGSFSKWTRDTRYEIVPTVRHILSHDRRSNLSLRQGIDVLQAVSKLLKLVSDFTDIMSVKSFFLLFVTGI